MNRILALMAFGAATSIAACAPHASVPVSTSDAEHAPKNDVATDLVDGAASEKPSVESLTIDFVSGSTVLSPTANEQLDGASRLYRDAKPAVMIVSGHSDKTGHEFDNLILSAHRAAIVKKGLVDRGVPAERLQIVAVGEAEPVADVEAKRSAVVTWR